MSKVDDALANTLVTPGSSKDDKPGGLPTETVLGDRYELVWRVGAGGFGAVYQAIDRRLEKKVAVKVLTRDADDPQLVERFRGEALAAGRLHHPSIAGATDFALTSDGRPYLVMEFVEGDALDKLLTKEGKLEIARAVKIVIGLCRALAVAHDAGIIHRDLKPANIILKREADGSELPKVLDFGLAKWVQQKSSSPALTDTGQMLGTPIYMPPEQIRGRADLDGRADLYAVGVILYELITGTTPFSTRSAGDVMVAKIVDAPEPPSKHVAVPKELERIILRAIAVEPDKRWASAKELAAALEPFASATAAPTPARRGAALPWVAGVAAVAAAIGYVAFGRGGDRGADRTPAPAPAPAAAPAPADAPAPAALVAPAAPPTPTPSPDVAPAAPIAAPAQAPDAGAAAPTDKPGTPRPRPKRRPARAGGDDGLYDAPRDRIRVP